MALAPKGKALGIDTNQYHPARTHYRPSDKFVIVRLTSGDGGLHVDSTAAIDISFLKRQKIPFAVYHFLGAVGGATEARYAVREMENLGIWGYKLVLDFEGTSSLTDAVEFIKTAKELLKPSLWLYRKRKRVGLYSGGHIKDNGGGTLGADFGWLADYNAFDLPIHWSPAFTKLWQYTSTSSRGSLDLDAFMGDPKNVSKFFAPINRRGVKL